MIYVSLHGYTLSPVQTVQYTVHSCSPLNFSNSYSSNTQVFDVESLIAYGKFDSCLYRAIAYPEYGLHIILPPAIS